MITQNEIKNLNSDIKIFSPLKMGILLVAWKNKYVFNCLSLNNNYFYESFNKI